MLYMTSPGKLYTTFFYFPHHQGPPLANAKQFSVIYEFGFFLFVCLLCIVALQCFSFWCTESESALCLHISPLLWISFQFRSSQSIEYSSVSYTVDSYQLSILDKIQQCTFVSPNYPILPKTLLTLMSIGIFYPSRSALQISSSIPRFQLPHIFVYHICFSLSDLLNSL